MNKALDISLCGCGRVARYSKIGSDGVVVDSCNKYKRCLTYEELDDGLRVATAKVKYYEKAIGLLDEYFEYESSCSVDRKQVNKILGNLADWLRC